MMEPDSAPPQIDTSRPHPARMYDFYLGGKDNYVVDREAAVAVLRVLPEARDIAQQNRAFLRRVVRYLVGEAGIRQIIDIGTGIPAAGNVHEVAQLIEPDVGWYTWITTVASRVVRTLSRRARTPTTWADSFPKHERWGQARAGLSR